MSTRAGSSVYALLTDGTAIEIRPARPEDFAALAADARIRIRPAEPAGAYLRQLQ